MLRHIHGGTGHEGRVTGLALLPDWTLASVSHDRTIRLWDLHTFKLIKTVKDAHETPLQGVDHSPDREEIVTWAMDNFAYVWDAVSLSTKYALVGHMAEVTQVACYSPYSPRALALTMSTKRALNIQALCTHVDRHTDRHPLASKHMQSHAHTHRLHQQSSASLDCMPSIHLCRCHNVAHCCLQQGA